jgi:hypothetical protein
MKKVIGALLLTTAISFNLPAFAAEPSLHEVYQAANSGHIAEAQGMMKEVLQSHPNSGKAHYVEAELLVKQGKLAQAGNELATAEKLSPGLSFATPDSVSNLKSALSLHVAHTPTSLSVQQHYAPQPVEPAKPQSNFPWRLLAVGLGLVAFIVWASRWMTRRNAVSEFSPSQAGYGGYRSAYPNSPSSPGYGPTNVPSGTGSGLGSQILGGLATGAAVGAGMVAGESLMHHFMDDKKAIPSSNQAFSGFDNSIPDLPSTPLNDMGGNDFGISDGGSWDDGPSDDWT